TAGEIAAVQNGKVLYDGGRMARCIDFFVQQTCDKTDADSRGLPLDCLTVFRGSIASGGTCEIDLECQSNNCTASGNCPPNTCCKGTCVGNPVPSITIAQIGQPCGSQNTICADGSYCDHNAPDVCAALKPAGSTCQISSECAF